jgi:IS5 family transposase
MQKPQNVTYRMLLETEEQIYDQVLPKDHAFRKLNEMINWPELIAPLRRLYKDKGRRGFDVQNGFKALIVQYWEDYSDREMERALRENFAIRWFCGFRLGDTTPDHSYFGELRSRIGADNLAKTFREMNTILESFGLFGNVFAVIDASSIISKTALWEERDRAIADGNKRLDNAVVSKYAADKEARWGAKSKKVVWYGYKRNASIDVKHGLIRKVSVTPANAPDFKAVKNIVENNLVYFTDKGYDYKEVEREVRMKCSYSACIHKNNNKQKNFDLDKWKTTTRMPFEGTFSKLRKRTKFRGQVKVFAQCIMESMAFNLKKAVTFVPNLA